MLTYPDINPVAVDLGFVKIHWYGLMYLIGFAAVWWLGSIRARQANSGWTKEQVSDVIFYGALGVILGGRIGYVLFYNFSEFINNPLILFKIWQGGMSFHGGMLGVFLAYYFFARKTRKTFFQVADFLAPMVPIGLGAGRMGNFINNELWGRAADPSLPWSMDFGDHIARHPSSLYQALTEGLLLFLILWFYTKKPRPTMAASGLFMIGYGAFRFITEFFRTPDAHIGFIAFGWMTKGQQLSIPMILAGVFLFYLIYRKQPGKAV